MSPQDIAIITSLIALLEKISSWPFAMFFFIMVIGPWVLALMLAYSARKRFESVVLMYENNVRLVEKYDRVSSDLKDVIILNTQTMTILAEKIKAGSL